MRRENNSKLFIVLGIIILLITGFVANSNIKKQRNYEQNGKEVKCEVVQIIQSSKGSQQVEAVYYDENGTLIRAQAIANRPVTMGEVFTGLVVPEKPNEIYCPPSGALKTIVNCVGYGFAGLGVVLIICGIVSAIRSRVKY